MWVLIDPTGDAWGPFEDREHAIDAWLSLSDQKGWTIQQVYTW